jgi:O-succinylbenzoic acid--CoA ligase
MVSCLAIGWAGAIVAPISPKAPPEEQRRMLDLMGVKILLTDVEAAEVIAAVDSNVQPVMEEPIFALKNERPWDMSEIRVLIATSGSTAHPKVVALSTEQLFYSAMGSAIRLGHDLNDRWLLCLPPHHVGGLSVLFRCIWLGTTVVLEPKFAPKHINALIDDGEVTQVSLTPTMLRALMDSREGTPFPGTLRLVLLGGSAADPALLDRAKSLSTPVVCTWGMTETASQAATSVLGQDPAGPLPPMPFTRIQEHEGQLIIWGPIAGRNSFESQDLGHVNSTGRVLIQGRADRFITSGGAQIDLAEIEEIVLNHPQVSEAVALGLRDPKWGQRPALIVVPTRSSPKLEKEALLSWCQKSLSGYKVPDHVLFIEQLPKNEMGKVQQNALRTLFQDADTSEGLDEFVGETDLLESINRDKGMDQGDPSADDTILSPKDLVAECDGIFSHPVSGDDNAKPLPHVHGAGEVGLGVDKGHSPSAPLKDSLQGLVPGTEHLLENIVTILEGTPKKGNAGTINVVKTDSDRVRKTHKDNSLGPTGKTP